MWERERGQKRAKWVRYVGDQGRMGRGKHNNTVSMWGKAQQALLVRTVYAGVRFSEIKANEPGCYPRTH
jgi:hypothetical protein